MEKNIIKSFGFRSIVDAKYQSWGGFTCQLFADEKNRREFDVIKFKFDKEEMSNDGFIFEQYKDDESLVCAYFGRPIEHTIVHFPIIFGLDKQLAHIKSLISRIFGEIQKNILSEPILVISKLHNTKITAYYLWQYK